MRNSNIKQDNVQANDVCPMLSVTAVFERDWNAPERHSGPFKTTRLTRTSPSIRFG